MRSFIHWNPKYIKDRISTLFYEKTCPNHPWLTRSANEFIESYLSSSDIGLEFGSGRSTIWLAKRIEKLTSVEHHKEWSSKVRTMLREKNISNVDYMHVNKEMSAAHEANPKYIEVINEFKDNTLDFCLVDGIYRDLCALSVINKIKNGGVLVIDNVNLYLPSESQTINSLSEDATLGKNWQKVWEQLKSWRVIWTCSGVTDTAIFIKPCK